MAILSLSEIRTKFNALLAANSYWSQFAGSQFITMLVTFIGQMVYRCQQYADSALAEGFISTATKRASILAAAEDRAYVGSRVTPSTGEAIITNTTNEKLSVPQYTSLLSDDQYPYLTDDVVTVAANSTATVGISQMEIVEVTMTVGTATEFLEIMLSRALTDVCYKIDVLVTFDGVTTTWTKSNMFRLATNTSTVYVEFYKPTEQLGVRFGDGTIGMIPPTGSTITLKVWCSSGDVTLLADQTLTPSDDSAPLADSMIIKSDTSITGGADNESTETTRNRAQYFLSYDNQVVWAEDYTFYLKQNVPATTWLTAWGEGEQEIIDGAKKLSNINKIFICGWYPNKTQEELKALFLSALESVPNPLNKSYSIVTANELPFTLTLTGEISASQTTSVVEADLKADLKARFGKDSSYFDPKGTGDYQLIKVKDIWSFIDGLSYFEDFKLTYSGMEESNGYNDFVYLDVDGSTFNISYFE
ncbi:bleomycin hydrolase [Pantoea sp. CCBC3-3-1]|uniref:bleomycin hydrolase n=1 Tax=Pantoea sp. CCBC3-3-1 TaxID=2490851 RepID=UPI0011BFE479|nr:bleomycin hydrolase [Pantoea sp. CCBC3-3-1]